MGTPHGIRHTAVSVLTPPHRVCQKPQERQAHFILNFTIARVGHFVTSQSDKTSGTLLLESSSGSSPTPFPFPHSVGEDATKRHEVS